MKKARFIFLTSLVLMAIAAFKGNPDSMEKNKQSNNHQKSTMIISDTTVDRR